MIYTARKIKNKSRTLCGFYLFVGTFQIAVYSSQEGTPLLRTPLQEKIVKLQKDNEKFLKDKTQSYLFIHRQANTCVVLF